MFSRIHAGFVMDGKNKNSTGFLENLEKQRKDLFTYIQNMKGIKADILGNKINIGSIDRKEWCHIKVKPYIFLQLQTFSVVQKIN